MSTLWETLVAAKKFRRFGDIIQKVRWQVREYNEVLKSNIFCGVVISRARVILSLLTRFPFPKRDYMCSHYRV